MSQFEFFMTFYGLLLGLGVTELMTGYAGLVRDRRPPRLGVMTPLIGTMVFVEMLANFVDAWNRLQDIDIDLVPLLMPTLIGVAYFIIAVIVVPRDLGDWASLDDYFDKRKRWIVGLLLAVNVVITIGTNPPHVFARLLTGQLDHQVIGFLVAQVWLLGSYVVLLIARRRSLEIAAAITVLLFYPTFYGVIDLGIFQPAAG